jgi:hypothetical protein
MRRTVPLMLFLALSACGAENALKNAKVGDFVAYKQSAKMGPVNVDSEVRQTITKKTDTEVTIEYITKMPNVPEMKREVVVKLDQDYDPTTGPMAKPKATVKQVDSGSEKLSIAGKSIEAKWVASEVVMKVSGQEVTTKTKVWTCPDVPLGGMVKMENDVGANGKSTMELTDFGTGK